MHFSFLSICMLDTDNYSNSLHGLLVSYFSFLEI